MPRIVLHALWTHGALHLWGQRSGVQPTKGDGTEWPLATHSANTHPAPHGKRPAGRATNERVATRVSDFALDPESLRCVVGDVYDSLLVSGASASDLVLRLPHRCGRPEPSFPTCRESDQPAHRQQERFLCPLRVATLVFSPADAVDLLTGSPVFPPDEIRIGASIHYWSRIAQFVLELLAKQRYIPAVHDAGGECFRGYWRVVVDDEETAQRLVKLIRSMPPVCRSMVQETEPVQAFDLLENFLWATVDALVRRCLAGDELAHAIRDQGSEPHTPQTRWLASLVGDNPTLQGPSEACRAVYQTVQEWVTRLEAAAPRRAYRTCLRLHSPPQEQESGSESESSWKLTFHVQCLEEPSLILDASQLVNEETVRTPRILARPFKGAMEQLRADVSRAARHFPPLSPCAQFAGPVECSLTLGEAHSFLRTAAPILELEGLGVWLPRWWNQDRSRLRMWLHVRPVDSEASGKTAEMGLNALVSYDWRLAVGDDELTSEEITRLAQAQEGLVCVRGRWTQAQPSEVQTALRFLKENRSRGMTVSEVLRQCYIADDLETGLPVAGFHAQGWLNHLFNASDLYQTIQPLDPPEGFRGTLRPYQLRGLEWLAFMTRLGFGACLADDMGLGKTIQMIALWLFERQSGRSPGPTLLVVPMSLVGNWHREIERFAPSLRVMVHHGLERLTGREFVDQVARHDVVISTYGLTHRDLDHLGAVTWHRVALDEAQNIKNPAAKQAMAIRSLRTSCRVALTGTPVENRLTELWSIMDFLNAGYLSHASDFRRRFAVPIERHHDTDRAQRLRHLIRPFILRRVKSDPNIEVDLPDKMEMKVYCNLTKEQAGLYQALVDDMLGRIDQAGGVQRRGLILATLVKLKQICNHPVHFLADGTHLAHRSGKCDRLTEMLEEVVAEGDQALIFTQFRKMGDLLQKLLPESLNHEVLFLHGGTSRKGREQMIDRFQTDQTGAPLLLLSLKAGGFGLNLTAASHVFHFDRWWNPATEDQATDRAHRIGQTKRVQVHKFICIGTLEERIDALLEQKRNLADHVVGTGEEWLTELSVDQLRKVFALSREAVAEE